MKFREWFESKQKADVLCWADEEAAATGWNAALEAAAVLAHEAWVNGGGSESSELPNAIRALKEQA